jgi:succinate dehydrogenase/fumarate reductase iron-sulfur protein
MERKQKINMKCFRFDPENDKEPYFEIYEIPLNGAMSVQDCLMYVRENIDPSIAFFINCRLGFCRRCLVRVNGKSCLACTTEVKDNLTIEPLLKDKVIRDLWCEGL